MLLIGKANWWFPKSLDRILPHIGLEHADAPEGRRYGRGRAERRTSRPGVGLSSVSTSRSGSKPARSASPPSHHGRIVGSRVIDAIGRAVQAGGDEATPCRHRRLSPGSSPSTPPGPSRSLRVPPCPPALGRPGGYSVGSSRPTGRRSGPRAGWACAPRRCPTPVNTSTPWSWPVATGGSAAARRSLISWISTVAAPVSSCRRRCARAPSWPRRPVFSMGGGSRRIGPGRQFGGGVPGTRRRRRPIYVRDGKFWTSAGVTAGVDLSLALVRTTSVSMWPRPSPATW